MKKRRYDLDMTQGPILPLLVRFAIPIALESMLQLLYNAADIAVIGRFASSASLAAVSAASPLINLMTTIFIGFSMGASVLVARAYGAGDRKALHEFAHAAITLALLCGAFVTVFGMGLSRAMLQWMNTPADVLELTWVYLLISFAGAIFSMLYNYGAAIMRAVGNSSRPTMYLTISGAVNVALNLLFVAVFGMDVAGVALATVLSQMLSAVLVIGSLMRPDSAVRIEPRKLRIVPAQLMEQLRLGLPIGIQKSMFSISNVILQTAVNGFGAAAMAGSGAAANLEAFVYAGIGCFLTANLTFTSQNMGARKIDRMRRVIPASMLCATMFGLVIGSIVLLFKEQLLGIYSTDPEVIAMGVQRLNATVLPYLLAGMFEAFVGSMRGMGYALWPMLVSVVGICGLRTFWVFCIFPFAPSLFTLYLSYPVSWGATLIAQGICCRIVQRKVFAMMAAEG